jgi:RNA polymerase primary sigma factor
MPTDSTTTEILKRFEGAIYSVLNIYKSSGVPQKVLEMEIKRQALQALKEWRPSEGTKPSSFLITRLRQRMFRYATENQTVVRIPEEQVRYIGNLTRAQNDLRDTLGREPSAAEIADHVGLPLKHVHKLMKRLLETPALSDVDSMEDLSHDPDIEKAMMAYYSLTPQEQVVFDHALGAHGKNKMNMGDIAKKLGVSNARVSAIKETVAAKIRPYLD